MGFDAALMQKCEGNYMNYFFPALFKTLTRVNLLLLLCAT